MQLPEMPSIESLNRQTTGLLVIPLVRRFFICDFFAFLQGVLEPLSSSTSLVAAEGRDRKIKLPVMVVIRHLSTLPHGSDRGCDFRYLSDLWMRS
jgi:hypothetical protein